MSNSFRRAKLYTWRNNKDWCHTAQIFKDGEPHGTMAVADANAWCEKWNGHRGNFEVVA